jgi:hypothetical protein
VPASFLVISLISLTLVSATGVLAPVQAQAGNSVWTDRSAYGVGEVVTIHVSPPVMTGVGKWLIVWKPDYSSMRIDFQFQPDSEIADSATVTADQPGHWRVELWSWIVYPGAPETLLATCTFDVQDTTPIPAVTVNSKTIFNAQLSGPRVKVDRRCHVTPFSLELQQGKHKFTAPSSTYVAGVRYNFARWEDETGTVSTSKSLTYNVQPGMTLYAVYGPKQYKLTLNVKDASTRKLVVGATVEVTGTYPNQHFILTTDSRGKVTFNGIYAGQTLTITITKDEYQPFTTTIFLKRNTTYKAY